MLGHIYKNGKRIENYAIDKTGRLHAFLMIGPWEDYLKDSELILCDGRHLSKVQHPELYKVLGSIYGETQTTFQIPNLMENRK